MIYSFLISVLSIFIFNGQYISPSLYLDDRGEVFKYWETSKFNNEVGFLSDLNISASSYLLVDLDNNLALLEKDSQESLAIASISKLMSVIVLMDLDFNPEEYYKIKASDRRVGGRDYVFLGEEIRQSDLLALSLIASDNTAIIALIEAMGLSEEDFVFLMNEKASEMGLKNTFFRDATGLSHDNVSSAEDLIIIFKEALKYQEIVDLSSRYEYSFFTKNGREKNIISTNALLANNEDSSSFNILIAKTGYNLLAGYCFGLVFKLDNGKTFMAVLLDSPTIYSRFEDSSLLINQTYNIYSKIPVL